MTVVMKNNDSKPSPLLTGATLPPTGRSPVWVIGGIAALMVNMPSDRSTMFAPCYRDDEPVSIRPRYVEREINAGLLLASILRDAEARFQRGER